MAAPEEIDARIDDERIRLGVGHQAIGRHVVAGRSAGHDADAFALEARIFQGIYAVEALPLLEHERVGRAVVGIGDLNHVIALRGAHDDVAPVRGERVAHEAGGLRIPRVAQVSPELAGEKLGDLILEALALLGRERHVVRVGTDSQRLGVDQFERRLRTLQRLPGQFPGYQYAHGGRAAYGKAHRPQPRTGSGFCHGRRPHLTRPTAHRRAQLRCPRQLLSDLATASGLSSRFCGLPRGTASLARARR